jgi:hypothetical protein
MPQSFSLITPRSRDVLDIEDARDQRPSDLRSLCDSQVSTESCCHRIILGSVASNPLGYDHLRIGLLTSHKTPAGAGV